MSSTRAGPTQPVGASRPYLKFGVTASLTYTFDASRPAGDRTVWAGPVELDIEVPSTGTQCSVPVFVNLSMATERVDAAKKAKKSPIDKVLRAFAKGDREAAKGRYPQAVDHDGHTWKHASKE